MVFLRKLLSRLRPNGGASATPAAARKGRLSERRLGERRTNIMPLPDRGTRLRFAAQVAGFGVYDMDCANGEIFWSPELKAIAGLPPDDAPLTYERFTQLLHPDDRERLLAKVERTLDPEGSAEFEDEHRFQRPDGAVRWVRAKGRTFFAGEGAERRPVGTAGVVMDITEGRAYQTKLAESQARLAELIESNIDAIVCIDTGQRIVLANPAASSMFRCRAEDMIGRPYEGFIPERFRATYQENLRHLMENGNLTRARRQAGTFLGLRADGEEFPLEASISRGWVEGQPQITIIARDISERRAAEEALRRSQQDLDLAVRGAALGIWNWDLRIGEMTWSDRYRQLLGLPAGEPASLERFLEVLPNGDREKAEAVVYRALEKHEEYKFEHRIRWPDGSRHWIAVVGHGCYDPESGALIGANGIARDITERKRLEEHLRHRAEELERRVKERTAELSEASEELVRTNLELQQFGYVAAHDLQTPLRSINGFAQLLQQEFQGRLGDQADVWIGQLVHHVERMHDLIQDLQTYAKAESPGRPHEPTDFNRLFDDIVASSQAALRQSGATVTRDLLPTVPGDRVQLAQVLQNLIGNALKYHGREPPR
ncbi:MAG: sensory transduction histidine kinase, partial [Rhodocyclaceae bacterium]|nr:sensory transduction histidine kinase [Rhodocyclaceae bacterium]